MSSILRSLFNTLLHSDRKPWPVIAHICGWIIVLVFIIGGAVLSFAYGLSFGNDQTYQWVVALITAFFVSVLLTQPLMVGKVILISEINHDFLNDPCFRFCFSLEQSAFAVRNPSTMRITATLTRNCQQSTGIQLIRHVN